MSRVGKRPISIPDSVDVRYESRRLKIKGPKGELSRVIHNDVNLDVKDGFIHVLSSNEMKRVKALQGLTRTLIENMVVGVTEGFNRVLEVNGVGYRVDVKSDVLTLSLGFSHPVTYKLPEGVSASADKNKIVLSGIDKELLGATAAAIRKFRGPEPYKGKGIKYAEEHIRRKAGKSVGK